MKDKAQPKRGEQKLGQPAIAQQERAEKLVDAMGQRLGHFAAFVSRQIQKATARVLEEAEDFWAEAQSIRHENSRKPQ